MPDTRPSPPRTTPPTASWNHPLLGADLPTLLGLLRHQHVRRPAMRVRMLAMLGAALARLPFSLLERAWVAAHRDPLARMPPPVFILGHWRSGTTHLFNLMSRDPRFAWPGPVATGLPWDFLLLGRLLGPLLTRLLPRTRFIDNVAVNADSPQEDEIALASMQGLSYYHALYFPADFARQFRHGIYPETGTPAARERRQRRFLHYCRKLLLQGTGTTLLIKNPVYTGQVAEMLALRPDARFIHIHRNPYSVLESTRKFYQRLLPQYALQEHAAEAIDPFILETYPRMLDRLYADTRGLPAAQFIELAYNELEQDPLGSLARIYGQLELGDFASVKENFSAYLEGIRGYRKNPHRYATGIMDQADRHWGEYIQRWGYARPAPATQAVPADPGQGHPDSAGPGPSPTTTAETPSLPADSQGTY